MNAEADQASRRYLLLDASAIIPYYVPEAAKSQKSLHRIQNIVDAGRHHHLNAHFYIPNIVVAEVFGAFARHCYSAWDRQIYQKYGGKGKALHGKKYSSARRDFRRDIHNGALFYQYDLNRYHILALDLIAPVDKYRKFYRKGSVRSMGASDLLIGCMALHLARVHGKANVALLTTDRRMAAIFDKACSSLNPNTAQKLGLVEAAKTFGFGAWGPQIYPTVIDLDEWKDPQLVSWFGQWPLETRKGRNREPKA